MEKLSPGAQELQKSYHPDDIAALQSLQKFSPDYFAIIEEFGLGNLWQRPGLTPREKELIALTALVTVGDSERQLRQHIHTAATRAVAIDDIIECLILLTVYIGIPRTYNAIEIVRTHMDNRP